MMQSKFFLAPLLLALALPVAEATSITAGTGEIVTFRQCVAGVTACDTLDTTGPDASLTYGGLPGNSSSSTGTVELGTLGTGFGYASLGTSAVDGAPFLEASANAVPGERVGTTVIALQSYAWNGEGPATRTFDGTLSYSQTLTGTYPPAVWGGINAEIDIFTMTPTSVDAGTTALENFDSLYNADGGLLGYADLGSAQYSDLNSNPDGSALLSDTVTLTPGQTIWVWTILQTVGTNGGAVDAAHTLITGWDNATGLVPAATTSVPEPSTLALLFVGLLGCLAASLSRRGCSDLI
jgi:PEP-CTERM motif